MPSARSRAFVLWLTVAAAALFLISAVFVGGESSLRTAIEEAARSVRSVVASRGTQTSPGSSPDRSTTEPALAARPEPIPSSPTAGDDNNPSPEPGPPPPTSSAVSGADASENPALQKVPVSPPAPKGLLAGTLTIASRPAGASVFIDEQFVGTTPMLMPDISPGIHVVRLQLAAHRDWTSTVQVVEDDRNRVTAALEEDENVAKP
jgi:hypothetical protein